MSKTFEIIEVVGISTESTTDAIKTAIYEVNKNRKVSWFEVVEPRGRITSDGKIEFQVTLKIGVKSND